MNSSGLTVQRFASFMVLSGLSFQRMLPSAVLAILFLVSTICLRAAEPDEVNGTMPEDYLPGLKPILEQALKRAPEILAKDFERLTQEARVIQVNASRLPSLGGSFNYGISQTATASDTSSQYRDSGFFYSFGLNQAIFHWGALKNQTDAARINLLVTNKSFALAYRELSIALRKAYLALIVEKARVMHGRGAVRFVGLEVEIAQARKKDGTISGTALATEELRLREHRLDLARAETEFAANRARFARLAGIPPADFPEEAIPNDIPRPTYSEPQTAEMTAVLLQENGRKTLEHEIYDLRVNEAVLRQKIENTRLLPKFSANAGYSLTNTTNVNGNLAEQRAVTQQTVGLGGSWNIFDGLATRGAKREALATRRSIEHRKAIEIDQLLQSAQILERGLKVEAEQVAIADIRHGTAVEGQRLIAQEVGFGRVPRIEVDRANVNILQAKAKNLEARAAFLSRWSDFVAIAARDPVLNNLPDRHVRK